MLILLVIFSLYKTKLVDLWVRQKRDQHVLQNTSCNGRHVTLWLSMTSQNDVKLKMADTNPKYFKVNLIYFKNHVSVQEKESFMSVRY